MRLRRAMRRCATSSDQILLGGSVTGVGVDITDGRRRGGAEVEQWSRVPVDDRPAATGDVLALSSQDAGSGCYPSTWPGRRIGRLKI